MTSGLAMNGEARDRNGNEFGSAKWRSPLTHRTSAEILEQRKLFNRNVAIVNRQVIAERERLAALEEKTDE